MFQIEESQLEAIAVTDAVTEGVAFCSLSTQEIRNSISEDSNDSIIYNGKSYDRKRTSDQCRHFKGRAKNNAEGGEGG